MHSAPQTQQSKGGWAMETGARWKICAPRAQLCCFCSFRVPLHCVAVIMADLNQTADLSATLQVCMHNCEVPWDADEMS